MARREDPPEEGGVILPLRARTGRSSRVANDPIVRQQVREEIHEAATPPPAAPSVEVRGFSAIERMMAMAEEAGIRPGDPMYTFVETVGILLAQSTETAAESSRQVASMTKQQSTLVEAATSQASAAIEKMAIGMAQTIEDKVSIQIGRAAVRLPAAIGRVRVAVLASALVLATLGGAALGYQIGSTGARSQVAADAGAPWSATWLSLRRWNDIDAAINAASCFYTAGSRKACKVPLFVEEAKPAP